MSKQATKATWYLLYCKSGQEARAVLHLGNQGIQAFFPQIQVEKMQGGKRKLLSEGLFPCYLFALLDSDTNFTAIRSTRGVRDFVRFGHRYAQVESKLIDYLQAREVSDKDIAVLEQVNNLPKAGDKVQVNNAGLNDVEAIFLRTDGEARSILLIKLLQQETEIIVSNKDISLLG